MKPGDLVIYRSRRGGKNATRTLCVIAEEVSGITDPRGSEYRWFNVILSDTGEVKLACDHYLERVL